MHALCGQLAGIKLTVSLPPHLPLHLPPPTALYLAVPPYWGWALLPEGEEFLVTQATSLPLLPCSTLLLYGVYIVGSLPADLAPTHL